MRKLGCAMTLAALLGCSAPQSQHAAASERAKPYYSANSLSNGYQSEGRGVDAALRTIAGIYAGTVKVKRVPKGFVASGSYSQAKHPEAFIRACRDADTDKDKVVTRAEADSLARKVYSQHAR